MYNVQAIISAYLEPISLINCGLTGWALIPWVWIMFNDTLRPWQSGWRSADGISTCIFFEALLTEQWVIELTHWGGVTHICVSKLTSIGSDNGLSPGRRQAIIWTNAVILLIGPLATNFSEILIEIHTSSFKKRHLKMSSAKCRLFCLGLNVLTHMGTSDATWST